MREKNPNYISSITEYTITRTTYLPEREEIVFDLCRKFLESLGPEFRDMFYIPRSRVIRSLEQIKENIERLKL